MRSVIRMKKGDTLIEVMISLAILTSVLTVTTAGSLNAWRASRLAGERSVATFLAQRQADALKAYKKSRPWSSFLADTSGSFTMKKQPAATGGQEWGKGPANFSDPATYLTARPPVTKAPFAIFKQNITRDSGCASTSSACTYTVTVTWESTVRSGPGIPEENVSLLVRLGDLN